MTETTGDRPNLKPLMNASSLREAAILREARQLPGEKRARYLDEACAGNAPLRREIEELLKADVAAGSFLAELAAGDRGSVRAEVGLDPDPTQAGAPGQSEQPGDTIDRYKLMEEVGEGGFGVVYVAEQKEPVKRRVALKIIKLGMDTKAVVARFEAERQALAMMDHPNIAKVLDAGTTQTGRPYFVMELVRGIRITDYCDQANLSTKERLELFILVCQAIQHAHQKGIIHRDIKPSNILVTLHDGVPVPKVIDFGIAKATEGRLTEHTIYTQLHQFIGTPAYMSPEQAEMSGLDIDTRSDIYSLGVLLYELLVGQTPFDAKELMSRGVDAMRKIIREEEPARPSTRVATLGAEELTTTARRRAVEASKLLHLLRGDLDWIVMKCLEKDRSRRYETANGLAVDLKRHLGNEPVSARPPSTAYRFQKAFRRNKLAFTAAGIVMATLVLGVAVSTWQAVRATRAEREQNTQRELTDRALKGEKAQRTQAEAERGRANAQARKAAEGQQQAERSLYSAKLNLVQQAWRQNNVGRVRELLKETGDSPQRGFEWDYWQRQIHQELITLKGHGASVESVAFSPDGQRIVSGCFDRTGEASATAKVWDAASGRELLTLRGHGSGVYSVAFSRDGKRIATGSWDGTAKVWDSVSGREWITVTRPRAQIWSVAFFPDGERIVTGNGPAMASVWEVASGKELRTFLQRDGEEAGVWSVAVSPDGQWIAAGFADGRATVWDANSGEQRWTHKGHSGGIRSLAFSPDGQRIVTSSVEDRTAKVLEAANGKELVTLRGHDEGLMSVAFSPDGQRILTGSTDQTARMWDAVSGQELFRVKGHSGGVHAVAFSPDAQRIATGSYDKTVKVWDAAGAKELTLEGHKESVKCLAFSPDGRWIATGSYDETVTVWETVTGKAVRTLPGHGARIRALAFSPDSERMVTGEWDGTAKVWDVTKGRSPGLLRGHSNWVNSVAFSSDGRRILTGSSDATAKLWEAGSGKELLTFNGHKDGVMSATFSPDGRWVATGSADRTAKVWDTASARELHTLSGHQGWVVSVAFSADGQRIVTGSHDGTAKVWEAATGKELFLLKGHGYDLTSAVFFENDQRIVTGSWDGTAKVWEAASGEELLSLEGHRDGVASVAVSPEGRRIATASWDKTAKVWEAATARQVTEWHLEEKAAVEQVRLELAKEAEEKRAQQAQDPGAIKQWLVLLPIACQTSRSLESLQQEQVPQEAQLRPRAGQRVSIGPSEWVWREVQLKDHRINFQEFLGEPPIPGQEVAYAVCYLESEAEQTGIVLKVGVDQLSKVYLNGREIYRGAKDSSYTPDKDVTTGVQLRAGLNVLVFKTVSGVRWLGSVRLTDAAGQPVKGLKVTLNPP